MIIKLPENAKKILDTMHKAGYEAYVVGGCVRDALLSREPGDWDITTNALPQDIKKLFTRTIDTGIQHGTVTVLMDKEGYEVTTYRIDGKYEDSRHPSEVTFTKSLTEDMKRRDFTINAMAYNEEEGLIDRFGGIEDLENKLIRCVGEPKERFTEDALRIMRAVRFSAQLDYDIEEKTKEAITELAPSLSRISAERIQTELVKLLVSDHPEKVKVMYELGITKVIIPEFDLCMKTNQDNPHHMYSVGEHIINSLKYVRNDKVLRLTMFLHDIAKPATITTDDEGINHFQGHAQLGERMAHDFFRRLKFDRNTMDRVCKLVKYHDDRFPATAKNVRRVMNRVGEEEFPFLLDVKYADTMAQSDYCRDEKLKNIEDSRALYQKIKEDGECVSLKNLAVNGKDLIEHGVTPGKQMGEILGAMLEDVIDEPAHNNKEYLLDPEHFKDFLQKDHQ